MTADEDDVPPPPPPPQRFRPRSTLASSNLTTFSPRKLKTAIGSTQLSSLSPGRRLTGIMLPLTPKNEEAGSSDEQKKLSTMSPIHHLTSSAGGEHSISQTPSVMFKEVTHNPSPSPSNEDEDDEDEEMAASLMQGSPEPSPEVGPNDKSAGEEKPDDQKTTDDIDEKSSDTEVVKGKRPSDTLLESDKTSLTKRARTDDGEAVPSAPLTPSAPSVPPAPSALSEPLAPPEPDTAIAPQPSSPTADAERAREVTPLVQEERAVAPTVQDESAVKEDDDDVTKRTANDAAQTKFNATSSKPGQKDNAKEDDYESDEDKPLDLAAVNAFEYEQVAKYDGRALNRYEQYRRSDLKNGKVKRVLAALNPSLAKVNEPYIIAVKGLAKMFVGDVTEMALVMKKERGDKGALHPVHLREDF